MCKSRKSDLLTLFLFNTNTRRMHNIVTLFPTIWLLDRLSWRTCPAGKGVIIPNVTNTVKPNVRFNSLRLCWGLDWKKMKLIERFNQTFYVRNCTAGQRTVVLMTLRLALDTDWPPCPAGRASQRLACVPRGSYISALSGIFIYPFWNLYLFGVKKECAEFAHLLQVSLKMDKIEATHIKTRLKGRMSNLYVKFYETSSKLKINDKKDAFSIIEVYVGVCLIWYRD